MMQAKSHPIRTMILIILAGIAVRAFAAIFTYVTNPDGMLYIQQAKAIYNGDRMLLRSCASFVSSYPFLIAAVHWIFPSWIDSARVVSVFFGSMTLIPLYGLLRRFVDEQTGYLCVLLYAFMPVLVGGSADLVRDPICWFFLVSGLYFFVWQLETGATFRRRLFYLISSYFLFLMAGWARPEAFMVLIFSCFYTFAYSLLAGERRYLFVAFFSLLLLGLFLMAGSMIFDPHFNSYSGNASGKLLASLEEYRKLRQQIGSLAQGLHRGALRSFLFKARNLVFLIDLGLLIGHSIAGIFYAFIPFFIFGLFGLPARLRKDPRLVYLFILVILGYVLLFVHVLQFWYLEDRFLYIVIFPGCILAAFGIETTTRFVRSRLNWKVSVVMIMISLYILGFGLGKNIKKREEDKVVFRQIAEYISGLEKPDHTFVPVLTASSSPMKLVPFYLNLDSPTGYCPLDVAPKIRNNEELIQYTQKNKVKYYVWDEKNWSKTQVDIHAESFAKNFEMLGRWYQKDLGSIVLFRRDQRMGELSLKLPG
jgi:4-amino-4-deoxy-L-arabinose transferase-like glycosyltransferase